MPDSPTHDPVSTDVNVALCKALGIDDVRNVVAVNLAIRPGRMPQVTVISRVPVSDAAHRMHQVVRQFDLDLRARAVPLR